VLLCLFEIASERFRFFPVGLSFRDNTQKEVSL